MPSDNKDLCYSSGYCSRNVYRELTLASWDALLLVDCKSNLIIDANKSACQLYGVNSSNLIGSNFSNFFSDKKFFVDILKSHRDYVPLRYQKGSNGRHFPVELSIRYIPDNNIEIAAIAIRDISDRIQKDIISKESDSKYKSLFEASPFPILVVNINGLIADANECALLNYGYDKNDLVGKPWELLEAVPTNVSFMSRPTIINSTRHLRRIGSDFIAEIVFSYFKLNGKNMVLAVVRDTTELTHAISKLIASEARWRFGIEGHGDALFDISLSDGKFFISSILSNKLGYNPDADQCLTVDDWANRVHPDDRLGIRENVVSLIKNNIDIFITECRLLSVDRTYRWFSVRAKILEDTDLKRKRLIGSVRDIHQLRLHRQQELGNREKIFKLERLATIAEMMSALAHEVNQPLTAIANYSSVCQKIAGKTESLDDLKKSLDEINSQALRAGEIVRRVRGLVRKGHIYFSTVNLNILMERVISWVKPQAEASDVLITFFPDKNLKDFKADTLQIEQALLNILRNAIESVLCNTITNPKQIEVHILQTISEVLISVTDSGTGLQITTNPDAIFEPFVSSKPEGMGMGLSIVRSVVEGHGGRFFAENRPSAQGAIFTIALPNELQKN
jgi:two-component system, LuxR family, sensor kinase FixL